MTESTPQDLLTAMTALLAKAGPPATAPSPSTWAAPPPAIPLVQGVGVPVNIARGRGSLRITLWLPAECAASPAALTAALDQLENIGIPLAVWEPRSSGWGGSSGNRWRR